MQDTPEIVARLTLTEKAALVSGENIWQTRAIPRVGLPPVWMSDGPHGIRKQIGSADHLGLNASEPATCFPTAATVANSWDEELSAEIGAALGREASAQGVNVLLGPGLNIKRSPLGGRNFEYFSEDPELSGRLAAAYVRGIQSEGVAATPKHFAINSQELRRMVSDSVLDERTMRELYLTAFEIIVREAEPWAIMSSYNLINGVYAHENAHLLDDILRREWGFDGAVISDWGGGNDAVEAVRAGGTLEMPSPGFDSAREIAAAVSDGRLAEADLDARVAEVIDLVRRATARAVAATVDADAHHALARRAAAESAVLLRNEDALLPLSAGTRVALVGEFADAPRIQGAGSSQVNPTRSSSLRAAIGATDLTLVGFARGYRRDGVADPQLVAEAVAAARAADVVVLALGQPESAESEGLDRSSIDLPADQVALLAAVAAANPRTAVVLTAGGVVAMPWLESAAALVHGYLGGQASAEALLDVLTGAVAPGGRLAETFPFAVGDTPTAGAFPSTQRTAEYREGLYVGYRYYETAGVDVAFPFGFGLGYTTFAYSDLELDGDEVRVTVTNTGDRSGSEVAQVYVGRVQPGALDRPVRALAGFAKVRLAPGDAARIVIRLGDRAFRFWDAASSSWQVEAGEYRVEVGPHVRALALSAVRELDGIVPAPAAPALARYAAADVRGVDDTAFAALLGRPVPPSAWGRGPLGFNDPIDRLSVARSRVARLVFRLVDARRAKSERAGTPDLNILFMFNGPFRVISKMSGGLATREVTDAVLTAVNGRTFRGLGAAAAAFFRGRRAERRSRDAFRSASGTDTRKGAA